MDRLASATGETALAGVGEARLLSDIQSTCEAWKDAASLLDVAARVALERAGRLGAGESAVGPAAYTGLLETAAEQRCLRDPTL